MLQQFQGEAHFRQSRSIIHAIAGGGNDLATELCIPDDDVLVGGRHTGKDELLVGKDIIKLLPLSVLGQFQNLADIVTLNNGSAFSIPHILVHDSMVAGTKNHANTVARAEQSCVENKVGRFHDTNAGRNLVTFIEDNDITRNHINSIHLLYPFIPSNLRHLRNHTLEVFQNLRQFCFLEVSEHTHDEHHQK